MSESLSVLVLAAGLGTRLRPYTDIIPKPLIPIVDKSILEHQVASCKKLREKMPVEKLFVNAHHLADQIQEASEAFGVDKVYVEHPQILGTGGPLHRVWKDGWKGELLVLNGDNFHGFDLAAFVLAARASEAPFALLCVDFPNVDNLQIDVRGRVCGRDGKYSIGSAVRKQTFSGVSWYGPGALSRILDSDFNVVDFWAREAHAGRFPLAYTEQSQATWIDMGSPEGLYRACEARLLELGVDRWVSPDISTGHFSTGAGTVICEGAWIGDGAKLDHCIILPNARIEAGEVLSRIVAGAGFRWML
jgi:NDP-sugar pyrophosphorylase family protein